LFAKASDAALAQAEDWMETRLAELAVLEGTSVPLPLQVSILTSTIAEWAGKRRRLAMAQRCAPSAAWEAASEAFWGRVAELIGLGDHAATLAFFAAGEIRRHLLVWHPVLDRALLEETVAALLLWLQQRQFAEDHIRPIHQQLARSEYHRPVLRDDALAATVAQAAADLLAEKGHAGVTFRAVGSKAGVTLGTVIHLCGSKSELLHGALHCLYEREALHGDREKFIAQSFPPDVILDRLLDAISRGDHPMLRAYDEIERAIYNGPEYSALRGVVRSVDDPSGTWALQQMLGGPLPPASLVAAFSAIIRGIGSEPRSGTPDAARARQSRATLSAFLCLTK
jgi:AcrR family transcriptional regulator